MGRCVGDVVFVDSGSGGSSGIRGGSDGGSVCSFGAQYASFGGGNGGSGSGSGSSPCGGIPLGQELHHLRFCCGCTCTVSVGSDSSGSSDIRGGSDGGSACGFGA
jgi:hypothetical protein